MGQNTFLRTFSITKPLAPAHQVREATNTSVGEFELNDSAASFLAIASPGMIVVNFTDSLWAKVVRVVSDTKLILSRHIFAVAGKTYRLLLPARGIICPGAGQEIILFRLWARNMTEGGARHPVLLSKMALEGFQTQPVATTEANRDFIEVNARLLPTDTEFYVFENGCLTRTDFIAEGLDKTLGGINFEPQSGGE